MSGALVVVTEERLAEIIEAVVAAAAARAVDLIEQRRKEAEALNSEPIAAVKAAKLIRCRYADLLAACKSGQLPATPKSCADGSTRWRVRPLDARAWAAKRGAR